MVFYLNLEKFHLIYGPNKTVWTELLPIILTKVEIFYVCSYLMISEFDINFTSVHKENGYRLDMQFHSSIPITNLIT